jgi:benzodiazapine receptor
LGVGLVGASFTTSSIPTWYVLLNKPPFNPPNWLFGPVWSVIYVLMGVSGYLIWQKGIENKKVRSAIYLFAIQLVLNGIWTPVFFGLKNILFALIIIIFLWIAILKTIMAFSKIDKTAAYLLYPYITWVGFASILNFSIWILNR